MTARFCMLTSALNFAAAIRNSMLQRVAALARMCNKTPEVPH